MTEDDSGVFYRNTAVFNLLHRILHSLFNEEGLICVLHSKHMSLSIIF